MCVVRVQYGLDPMVLDTVVTAFMIIIQYNMFIMMNISNLTCQPPFQSNDPMTVR